MKQVLQPDHLPRNNFVLRPTGIHALTLIEMSGIEEEIEAVELPDRTFASGGHTKPFEFTFSIPAHHRAEVAAVYRWYQDCQEPVDPTYKKDAVYTIYSISASSTLSYVIEGMFLCKWKTSDNEASNEGEMHTIEITAKGDRLRPLL